MGGMFGHTAVKTLLRAAAVAFVWAGPVSLAAIFTVGPSLRPDHQSVVDALGVLALSSIAAGLLATIGHLNIGAALPNNVKDRWRNWMFVGGPITAAVYLTRLILRKPLDWPRMDTGRDPDQ